MDPRAPTTEDEVAAIAVESYEYLYPLVLMEVTVTRRQSTNADPALGERQPYGVGRMNELLHSRVFPPPHYRGLVRPSFDTLYSVGWLDLSVEPLIISVPETQGRFYMLQILDMWTDTFGDRDKDNRQPCWALLATRKARRAACWR
eukprot:TRINITY_DN1361_c0_g1_i1.p2 TRINITY_DN1361_c0_g1~~TRINITY_DN1361_c0_g1_i1.p2  ORF type:complete len:146 (+),score=19.76 TRINITY_DN1361_c0_g1_i1:40-477(+)